MAFHVREEETLDSDALIALQDRKLRSMLRELAASNAFWRRRFAESRFEVEYDPLQALPLLTRADLEADQAEAPPYGTNLTYPLDRYPRLHQTSGSTDARPLRWLDTHESWSWWKRCWGIVYRAAGIIDADRFFLPFSFGPFIGFWGAFESAVELGNFCLPAGGMSSTARLHDLLDHRVTVVCCTPTYALRLAEVAQAEGFELVDSSVRALIVAGEPGGHVSTVRTRIESAWGARVFDHAGMTEVGPWGFECVEDAGGMHVLESEFIAEMVDPVTGQAVADGSVGELVLTNLGRRGSPLIRYRTGDQGLLIRGRCACGRWFSRLAGGILGRTDDMLHLRGNNVFPSAIEEVLRGIEGVEEYRVEVRGGSSLADLLIVVEAAENSAAYVADRVRDAIRNRFHFQPTVRTVARGTLPRFEMKARRFVRVDGDRGGMAS